MNRQEPELTLIPTDAERVESEHEKLMRAYRKLNQQLDAAIERIRKRRSNEPA